MYVSSEGAHSRVLEVPLPDRVAQAVAPPSSSVPVSPSPGLGRGPGGSTASPAATPGTDEPASRDAWPWLAGGLLAAVAVGVLLLALRPR